MSQTLHVEGARRFAGNLVLGRGEPLSRIVRFPQLPAVLAAATACACFAADVIIPRGATPAVGYVLCPVLAGGSGKRSVSFGMTLFCTALTVAGYFLEPAGAAWWTSAWERLIIVAVLWAALYLVLRRLALIEALAERTDALEQATDELSRSNAELDRFASVVAHDLRGPLSAIGLGAQFLLSRDASNGPDAETTEWLHNIRREVTDMSRLIERLLAYGHVGGGALRVGACDCNAILDNVTRALSATLQAAGAGVTHDPLPTVRADGVLVFELLQNLIENAVKYRGPRPPSIHISAVADGSDEQWIFSVRDNGIGIPEADRATVFRPFTQLKHTGKGVGLGLATCKRIVERHGGRIWVAAAPAAGGCDFRFSLPAAGPHAA